jgi:ABC-type multidrug transport system ATPase subunit/ABC-type multidrug transport system permease subunit
MAIPEMRVGFRHLSLSADMVAVSDTRGSGAHQHQLPTVTNQVRNELSKLAAKKTTVRKHILSDVSGVFRPGETTLVLGQPGSGKSALMKVLSGRFPLDKHITLEGDVAYNGVPREQLVKRLPQIVSYVTQQDTHLPTLTVKETLQFAYECSGGADRQPQEGKSDELLVRDPDMVIAEMGLQNCQDTVIGNAMLRGVSGGERKRVTTGEMQFGVHAVSLMDEISTGLDSAATFDIVKAQRHVARKWRKTTVISLLQPSPEVFALFDNVLLMNSGEVIYNGSRDRVVAYFESLGFKCPPRRDIADFLCDVASDAQVQYQTQYPPPGQSHHPRTGSEFARLWRESQMGKTVQGEADELMASDSVHQELESLVHIPEFIQDWWSSTLLLAKREAMVMLRNVPLVGGRIFLAVFIGLLFGSLFWDIDPSNALVFMGLVFAAVVFLGLNQAAMLAPFLEVREVFYKQRRANMYRTSSYVIATFLSHTPLIVIESLVFGSIVYWMAGFVADVGAYFLFELFLILTSLTFLAWFFFLSSACPNLHMAEPLSMLSLLALVLFAGFVVSKDNLPDYVVWLYWVDPVSWAVRAIAISQYRNGELDKCVYGTYDYCSNLGMTMGEYELSVFALATSQEWIVYGIIFLAASFVLSVGLAYLTRRATPCMTPPSWPVARPNSTAPNFLELGHRLSRSLKRQKPGL